SFQDAISGGDAGTAASGGGGRGMEPGKEAGLNPYLVKPAGRHADSSVVLAVARVGEIDVGSTDARKPTCPARVGPTRRRTLLSTCITWPVRGTPSRSPADTRSTAVRPTARWPSGRATRPGG